MSLFTPASNQKYIEGSCVFRSALITIYKINIDNGYQDKIRERTQTLFCTSVQIDMYYYFIMRYTPM